MTTAVLFYDVEEKAKTLSFKQILLDFFSGRITPYKAQLKDLSISLEGKVADLSGLKKLEKKELRSVHLNAKKFSSFYDKLNEKYYEENYFNDVELKGLLRSVMHNLHKIENLSFKYLHKGNPITPTPDYIKETLSQFSKDIIIAKTSAIS